MPPADSPVGKPVLHCAEWFLICVIWHILKLLLFIYISPNVSAFAIFISYILLNFLLLIIFIICYFLFVICYHLLFFIFHHFNENFSIYFPKYYFSPNYVIYLIFCHFLEQLYYTELYNLSYILYDMWDLTF